MLYSLGTIKAVNRNDRFTSIRDVAQTSQMRKYRSFAGGSANWSNRAKADARC